MEYYSLLKSKFQDFVTFLKYRQNHQKILISNPKLKEENDAKFRWFYVILIQTNIMAFVYIKSKPKVIQRLGKLEGFAAAVLYNTLLVVFAQAHVSKLEMIKYFKRGHQSDFKRFQLRELDPDVEEDLRRYLGSEYGERREQ